jgi:hypothetical protein
VNPIIFLISFSPWILFGVLSGHTLTSLEIALMVSLILSFIVGYRDLKDRLIVPWVTVFYFLIAFLVVAVLKFYPFIPFIGMASNGVLTGLALGSLAIGIPFTSQYAKRDVPPEKWGNSVFIHINKMLTLFWGILFMVGLTSSIYEYFYPNGLGFFGDAVMWIDIGIGIVVTMKYPDYYKKRIGAKSSGISK